MYPTLKLKPGKEPVAASGHPWIFSGALDDPPDEIGHGSLVRLVDAGGSVVGVGTYSARSAIAVRIFDFSEAVIDEAWFAGRFRQAESLRKLAGYGPRTGTTGYRLIFGEADGVPGVVIDRYDDILVVQLSTAGADALRETVVKAVSSVFSPRGIYERSDMQARKEEFLAGREGLMGGEVPDRVRFEENGLKFVADVKGGQKTGFFLDQKDLRKTVMRLSKGAAALNLFSYTGAGGVAALAGGADKVLNVDSSCPALEMCQENAKLNGFKPASMECEESDVFQWLSAQRQPEYGLVMLDPPALIKSRRDAEEGGKAYHFLNRAAMRLVKDGGIFTTSSCSRFLGEDDLLGILKRASIQSEVALDILAAVRQSSDHPLSAYFPESSYLKSFVCRVRR